MRPLFLPYNLDKEWNSHELIEKLRQKVVSLMPDGLYDPQDLEHQVLFRLTTFDPSVINDDIIRYVVDEQFTIIRHRLEKVGLDIEHLFRGLSGNHNDLNVNARLRLEWENGKLTAVGDGIELLVEFRLVEDESLISIFTNDLHYIHSGRMRG